MIPFRITKPSTTGITDRDEWPTSMMSAEGFPAENLRVKAGGRRGGQVSTKRMGEAPRLGYVTVLTSS